MAGIDKLYTVNFKNRGINYFSKCHLTVLIFFFINNFFFSHEELLFPDMLLQIVTN